MRNVLLLVMVAALVACTTAASAAMITETFDSYPNGTILTNILVPPDGTGPWTIGTNYSVVNSVGVAGSKGLSVGSAIFNWKAQPFLWSALPAGNKMLMGMDFQTDASGKFNDDRVGWTNTPDGNGSSTNQLTLQLDNTQETGMVVYWNSTRTQLNPLAGLKNSAWYRFEVEFTKLTNTSAGIVGTLTELDASGSKTGTPYVGTIADTSTFANPPTADRFAPSGTATFLCPSYKNYNGDGQTAYADNVSFDPNVPVPEPSTIVLTVAGLIALLGCLWRKRV